MRALALAATWPGQLAGLLLVLGPAVISAATISPLAQVLAVAAGLLGAAVVFGGLGHRLGEAG